MKVKKITNAKNVGKNSVYLVILKDTSKLFMKAERTTNVRYATTKIIRGPKVALGSNRPLQGF